MVAVDTGALDELRGRIQHDVDCGLLPGAQFALAHAGAVVVAEAFGDVAPDDRLALHSATKAVPAIAVWRLLGDGRLRVDQRVVEVLPWFRGGGKDDITVDHVLCHTAGLPRAPLGPPAWFAPESRRDKMASWYVTSPPGETYEYHPTSSAWIQAELLAAVTGTDHCTAIHALVTEPLGLPAILGVDDRQVPVRDLMPIVGTTDLDLGEVTQETLLRFNDHDVRRLGVPGAGGYATAAALALLYQALLHNPGALWDPEVLRDGTSVIRVAADDPLRMAPANRTRGLIVAGDDGKSHQRGFGVGAGPRTFGHDGAAGQIAWADPDTGVSFAFLSTALDGDMVRQARRSIGLSTRAMAVLGPPAGAAAL